MGDVPLFRGSIDLFSLHDGGDYADDTGDPGLPGPLTTNEVGYEFGSFVIQPMDGVLEPITVRLRGLLTHPTPLPLSGKVPLIVLAHGRHTFAVENFRGLAYLAHHLSSYGYLCALIDLNDLGGPQGTLFLKRPRVRVGSRDTTPCSDRPADAHRLEASPVVRRTGQLQASGPRRPLAGR